MEKILSKGNLFYWLGTLTMLSVICFVLLFFSETQIPNVFTSNGIVAIISAFIGVFMTVAVTAILLGRQAETQKELLQKQFVSEELKEQNVKVFETRKEKYDDFINNLWKIWDKRSVSLEDVNGLLKMVSQNIILYTNPEKSDNTPVLLSKIQGNIFGIINALAKEINLGGEINENVRGKLNSLENKLLPYINSKEYVKKIDEYIRSRIGLTKFKLEPDETSKELDVLWWYIDKGMWLRVGDQEGRGKLHISFWSDFYENPQYNDYRYRVRGQEKNWMKSWNDEFDLDFNDFRNGKTLPEGKLNELAEKIKEVFEYKDEAYGGKTISELIDECNPPK